MVKNRWYLTLATLAWILVQTSPVAAFSANSDPNLIALYKLDETAGITAKDSSSHANDGTLMGDGQWVTGWLGGALEFNGSNTYMDCGDDPDISVTDSITIAAWLNCNSFGDWRGIATKGQNNSPYAMQMWGNGSLRFAANWGTVPGESGGGEWNSTTLMTAAEWIHAAATYGAGTITFYLNGAISDVVSVDLQFGQLNESLILGCDFPGGDEYFDGKMDDVRLYNRTLSEKEVQIAMLGLSDTSAIEPYPDDEVTDVPRDSVLTWTPGGSAQTHDVYFGTVWEDVNDATNPISQGQDANAFDPGRLEFGQTYFWRVDEVNGAPDFTVFPGEVWSFTAEPFSYPVTPVAATASSSHAANMGPDKTIDGSGLNELDQHSVDGTHMWLSGAGVVPAWIQYEFDKVHKLDKLSVWNSNQIIEAFMGLSAKDVVIETSVDGTEWVQLADVAPFAQGTGSPAYTANTVVDFAGTPAKFVKITINSGYGFMPQYGLSEVRFFSIPVQAREPMPVPGAVVDSVDVTLKWRPGREAASHEVYLGTDPADLALLATVNETSHDLSAAGLEHGTTYYWQISEVNEAATPTSHAGEIWSFSTSDFFVVDDFESYNDACARIFFAWQDGWGHNGGENIDDCGVPPYNGNGTGSLVGNNQAPFAERVIVHSGRQSMPLGYEGADSEAQLEFSLPQDWTKGGVTTLALYTYGHPDNTPAQMYVKVNNAKVLYDGDANHILRRRWTQWNIDLTSLGISLGNVTSLGIGVESTGTGTVFVDDIRLYRVAPPLLISTDPGSTGLVAYYAMDNNVEDGSGNGHHGTHQGSPQWAEGVTGSALQFSGSTDYVEVTDASGLHITNAITIAVWSKANTFGDWRGFVVKGVDSSPYAMQMWGDGSLRFGWNYGTPGAGAVGSGLVNSNGKMPLEEWAHLAVTYDGATLSFYLNGGLDTQVTTSFVFGTNDEALILGADFPGGDEYFDGVMDEVRVYNRALLPGEVMFLGDLMP